MDVCPSICNYLLDSKRLEQLQYNLCQKISQDLEGVCSLSTPVIGVTKG